MEPHLNNSTDSVRIELTNVQMEALFLAMEKLAKKKRRLILANHPPEYWDNYLNRVKQRREGIREEKRARIRETWTPELQEQLRRLRGR